MRKEFYMLNDLDFNQKIKAMKDRELLEFMAVQVWETCQRCAEHDARIKALEVSESYAKKLVAIISAIASVITSATVSIIGFLIGRKI
jgi:hypothetical protein